MASVNAVLFIGKKLTNGEHPIMIRVTINRKSHYLALGYSCLPSQWDEKAGLPNRRHKQRAELELLILKKIERIKKAILDAERNDEQIDIDAIFAKSDSKNKNRTFISYAEEIKQGLIKEGRISTARSYYGAALILVKYAGQDLLIRDITYNLLTKVEEALLANGLKKNAIRVYMASIRTLYQRAEREGLTKPEHNPFRLYKVSKLKNAIVKRAITKDEIKRIEALKLDKDSSLYRTQQYFLFMYYCRGMNFKDFTLLKRENIVNDRLIYVRKKNFSNFKYAVARSSPSDY